MVNRRVAAAMICFILLDDDEVKTNGKTQSWIKEENKEAHVQIESINTHGGYCQFQRNTANGL